ncbi:MAG: hypothetical protein WKF47_14930 [Geodermatophilaceae bacterium]
MTWASGSASTDAAIDSIGVMPDPAAMHRWRPPASGSARKLPVGVCTSTLSPAPDVAHQPGREQPAGDLAHPDPRRCAGRARRSSTTGAAPAPSIVRRRVSD